jgi:hypothetical protein
MFISEEEKLKILEFYKACNEMIEGRFILSDTKVSNILKCVVKSELLYNLYSRCMVDFNFNEVLNRCVADSSGNGGFFAMSEDDREIVAFVTCLLLEVDKKNINLQTFVTDNFFSADGYNISYNNFALTVLVAYKKAIVRLVGMDETGEMLQDSDSDSSDSMEEEEDIECDQGTKILFANLLMNLNELQNIINDDYKIKYQRKEELLIVIKALNKAIHMEDLLIINALLVPLEIMPKKNKKFKETFERIKILIADIYY